MQISPDLRFTLGLVLTFYPALFLGMELLIKELPRMVTGMQIFLVFLFPFWTLAALGAYLEVLFWLALAGAGVGLLASPFIVWRLGRKNIGFNARLFFISILSGSWVAGMSLLLLAATALD